jgi:hypothetical protein
MGSMTRGAIITFAFAAALIVPALAGLAREPSSLGQSQNACWNMTTSTNAGAMFAVCSSDRHW